MPKQDSELRLTLTFVALLRGINVGGNRIIPSAELKKCFEKMGFGDVKVILQSGNVKFTSVLKSAAQVRSTIEAGLTKQFSYPAKAVVVTMDRLSQVIAEYPFDASQKDEQHYVVFFNEDLGSELTGETKLNRAVEQVQAAKMIVYWRVQKGMTLKSDFGKLLSKAKYKDHHTVRNLNTLHKIVKA